jgi:hypothetical protein
MEGGKGGRVVRGVECRGDNAGRLDGGAECKGDNAGGVDGGAEWVHVIVHIGWGWAKREVDWGQAREVTLEDIY